VPRDFGPVARSLRFRDLAIVAGLVFVALAGRLIWLQLVQGSHFRALSEENRIRPEILRAERGRILDRNGVVLADNAPSYRLVFDPGDRAFRRDAAALDRTCDALAEILGRDPEELRRQAQRSRRRQEAPLSLARNLTFEQLSRIEERAERLPGVEVAPESIRRYPGGTLACHALGHLGEISEDELASWADRGYNMGDLVGRAGLERQYEDVLRGLDGADFVEVDALGRRTNIFPELPSREAVPGNDLVVSLDAGLQKTAERALDALPRQGRPYPRALPPWGQRPDSLGPAVPAALVALDPRTGEILALASRPAFDPNLFVRGLTKEDWRILNAPGRPQLHRAVASSYPPGSVFKVFTSLAGLESGALTPTRTFSSCTGGYFYGNRTFRCWRKGGHGVLGLSDALVRSCDVYFYQAGIALGVERFGEWGERSRVAQRTGIDLPEERAGLVPTLEWYHERYGKGGFGAGAALNLAIGQGEVLLTPLEIARFVGAVAVGGRMMRPHLLRRVQSVTGAIQRDAAAENWDDGVLPFSPENIRIVAAAMERVVGDNAGTGAGARVGRFRIAGKTGTAQNPHGNDHAVFACFATVDDPRLAVAVIAEESGHGGSIAAPVAQRVLQVFLTGTLPEDAAGSVDWDAVSAEGD
jgi:penicillin-binding protein 2